MITGDYNEHRGEHRGELAPGGDLAFGESASGIESGVGETQEACRQQPKGPWGKKGVSLMAEWPVTIPPIA